MRIASRTRSRSFFGFCSVVLTCIFLYNSPIMGCYPEKFRIIRKIVVLPRKFLYNYNNKGDYSETFSIITG